MDHDSIGELPTIVEDLLPPTYLDVAVNSIEQGNSSFDDDNEQYNELLRQGYRQAVTRAINHCVDQFINGRLGIIDASVDEAGKLLVALSDFQLPGAISIVDISPTGYFNFNGDARHVCEGANVFMPGSVSSLGNRGWIVQATLHTSEALGQIDGDDWPNPWTGPQPEPNPTWHFLNRKSPSNSRSWLRNLNIGCVGTTPIDDEGVRDQCDEWPWAATQQGGTNQDVALRPHLRIIDASQNQRSGSELGQFYSSNNPRIACNVQPGEFFVTLPLTSMFLPAADPQPPIDNKPIEELQFSRVESASICFGTDE